MRYKHSSSLDKKFKAIANNTRREIIALLKSRPMNAGEIVECFGISCASISHHLRKLEGSGLVVSKQVGQYRQYNLQPEAFQEIYLWLASLTSI